jgi:hypothetical protein
MTSKLIKLQLLKKKVVVVCISGMNLSPTPQDKINQLSSN